MDIEQWFILCVLSLGNFNSFIHRSISFMALEFVNASQNDKKLFFKQSKQIKE